MIDADTIYIGGEQGALFKTTNGGTNWIDQSVPTLESITAITFAPGGQGYAIGTNSVVLTTSSSGNITLSTSDGKVSGLPKEFILKQNYPNPFNPSTTIRYELPQQSDVKLKIYDMLGREVQSLVSERQPAGTYTVRFNGSRLSSGMYFYRLQTGSTVQTKKMLLVK
ncbi:MAG: T9SS type A sorting domain-containing protein [Rhizobacter sp.]|nr:T9SS type A sorting domain-containing protein [Chlorobiales bacterium]